MTTTRRMGLAGTGYWARVTHAPAVVASQGWELTSVWGRSLDGASAVAAEHAGVTATDDFDAFLEQVDGVTFALPPHVQAPLALRAIKAGKHVLLEKPISLDVAEADALVAAARDQGVATVVLFTMLFDPRVRAIVARCEQAEPLRGGGGLWLGSALNDDNPFNTPWRHDKGGLWDLGPHALSILWKTVGPIREGRAHADDVDALAALTLALDELGANARSGELAHPCDVAFGRDIVRLLADAEEQLTSAGATP